MIKAQNLTKSKGLKKQAALALVLAAKPDEWPFRWGM